MNIHSIPVLVNQCLVLLGLSLLMMPGQLSAQELEECLLKKIRLARDSMTIGALRLECEKEIHAGTFVPDSDRKSKAPLVTERIQEDKEHVLQPFTLMAHKPNYILFGVYNGDGYDPEHFQNQFDDPSFSLNDVEAQFQLSIKFPLLVDILDTFDIYAAYTNRSFWQVYNDKESSPFRETNHEPEAWVQFHPQWELFGFTNAWNSFGIVHQSNGRGGDLSRSWNRIFGWFTVERGSLAMSIKPWIRISEDYDDDDNPDITDYLGHGEFYASYKWRQNVFSLMSRNNLESGFSKGAVELSWSFPLPKWPYLKGYVHYFNGYGESLIDYNQHVNSIGIGLSLTDWL
jgi:phospholipase A1